MLKVRWQLQFVLNLVLLAFGLIFYDRLLIGVELAHSVGHDRVLCRFIVAVGVRGRLLHHLDVLF